MATNNKYEYTLPIGTILTGGQHSYKVVEVLGQGGFGITYKVSTQVMMGNIPIDAQFAVKEHYISSMNGRQGTSVSIPNASNTEEIKESIDSFLVEAQRLNRQPHRLSKLPKPFRSQGTE